MKGSHEFHSSLLSSVGDMQGFTIGGGFVPYSTPQGKALLNRIPGISRRNQSEELLSGLSKYFRGTTELQLQVAAGGAMQIQLGGLSAPIPASITPGLVSLGGAPYAGNLIRSGGTGAYGAFEIINASIQKGMAGGRTPIIPGISIPTMTPEGLTEWLTDTQRGFRTTFFKGIRSQRGYPDISRAYWMRQRAPIALGQYGDIDLGAQYSDLQQLHKRFSTGEGGVAKVYEEAQGRFATDVLRVARQQHGADHPWSFIGIKEGGIFPHLRKKGGTHAYASFLDPNELVPFAALSSQRKKGFHQGLKQEVMTREKLSLMGMGNISGRLHPYVVPTNLFNKTLPAMARMEAASMPSMRGAAGAVARASDITTSVGVTALMVQSPHGGMSDYAKRWIIGAFGDSQVVMNKGSKLARAAAGYGERFYTLDAPGELFKTPSDVLRQYIDDPLRGGLTEGGAININIGGKVGLSGQQLIDEAGGSIDGRAVLGFKQQEGAWKPITIGKTDVLSQVSYQGGKVRFTVQSRRTPQVVGRAITMGAAFRRFTVGRFGNLGFGDVAMRMEDMKFGDDAAQTLSGYLSHAFGQAESKLGGSRARVIAESLAPKFGGRVVDHPSGSFAIETLGNLKKNKNFRTNFEAFYGHYISGDPKSREFVSNFWNKFGKDTGITPAEQGLLEQSFHPRQIPFASVFAEDMQVEGKDGKRTTVRGLLAQRRSAQQSLNWRRNYDGRGVVSTHQRKLQREAGDLDRRWSQVRGMIKDVRKQTKGTRFLQLKHQAQGSRTLEPTIRGGERAIQYRLSELSLFQARMFGAPKHVPGIGNVRGAMRTLYKESLLPQISKSGAASDMYRLLGQFTDSSGDALMNLKGMSKPDVVKLDQLRSGRFSLLPNAQDAFLTPDQLKGKTTLLSQGGKLRKGGFFFQLPEWYIKQKGGKGAALALSPLFAKDAHAQVQQTVGAFRKQLYFPGLELFGKSRFEGGRLYLEGGTQSAKRLKPFGDYLQAIGKLEGLMGTGGEPVNRETLSQGIDDVIYSYNRFASTLVPKLVGKEGMLKKLVQADIPLALFGKHISYNPQNVLPTSGKNTSMDAVFRAMGSDPSDALTVGVERKWFQKSAEKTQQGQALWNRYLEAEKAGKKIDIFGLFHAYPASEGGHQQVVRLDLMDADRIARLNKGATGRGVVATTEALRRRAQRDLDTDDIMMRIFTSRKETEAAKKVYQWDLPMYSSLQKSILETRSKVQTEPFSVRPDVVAKNVASGHAAWDTFALTDVVKQKTLTPLSHVTYREHQDLLAMMGAEGSFDDASRMFLDAAGGPTADPKLKRALDQMGGIYKESMPTTSAQAGEYVDYRLLRKGGISRAFGEAWTASIYSVLKKDTVSSAEALEQFHEVWKGYSEKGGSKVINEIMRGAGDDVPLHSSRLGYNLEKLYTSYETGDADQILSDLITGRKSGNVAGTQYLRSIYNAESGSMAAVGSEWRGASSPAELSRMVRRTYFEPVAESMANLELLRSSIRGPGAAGSALSSQISLMSGFQDRNRFESATSGVLGFFERLWDVGGKGHKTAAMSSDAMAVNAAMETGFAGDLSESAIELINETGFKQKGQRFGQTMVGQLKDISSRLWNTKAGKFGMVGAGALMGFELLRGAFGNNGLPQSPTWEGGGAPMPPRPLLDTMAQKMNSVPMSIPDAPIRVERPQGMRQTMDPTLRSTPSPSGMVMGYSSAVPPSIVPQHPEDEVPQASPWEMDQYLGRVMRSSF